MRNLLLRQFHLLTHCEDVVCTFVSNFHLKSSQLEAMPEAVPLQRLVNGLHLYVCCQIQPRAFALLFVVPTTLPLHTVPLLITRVIAPALYD